MRKEFTEQIEYVRKLKERGAEMMAEQVKTASVDPPADIGIFGGSTFPAFEFGKAYEKNDLFSYEGKPGFVRQAHTSQETWIPFSTGTESLYGARPKMNDDGTYDYVYNMAASVGMLVNDGGKTYECIQDIDVMIWPPAQIPAHFNLVGSDTSSGSDEESASVSEWVQPTGAHDAYSQGATVTHNGKTWTSDVDSNVWEPGVYGWTEVTA